MEEIKSIEDTQKAEFGVNTYLNNQINDYKDEAKGLNESEIIEKLSEIEESRHHHEVYTEWLSTIDKLKFKIKTLTESLNNKSKYLDIDIDELNEKSINIDKKLADIDKEVVSINDTWNLWTTRKNELMNLELKGKALNEKLVTVKSGICPECKQPLPDIDSKVKIINDELSKLRSDYLKVRTEYRELSHYDGDQVDVEYYRNKSKELVNLRNSISQAKMDINSRIGLYNSAFSESTKLRESIDSAKLELDKELAKNLVDTSSNYTEQDEYVLRSDLSVIQKYKDLRNQLDASNEKLKSISDQLIPLKEKYNRFIEYSKLMNRTGKVFEEILIKLADSFTSGDIKYQVSSGVSRGKNWIQFNSYYKVKKRYRVYESLSDGQKNVSDLDFLSKLFLMKVGLLVLDEYVKHLDEDNSLKASEILGKMNVGTLMISTHSSNYPIFTRKVFLKLNAEGQTVSELI